MAFSKICSTLYNSVFRRTSTTVLTIAVSAIFFERSVYFLGNTFFDYWNRGRQWKDIKHLYEKKESEI